MQSYTFIPAFLKTSSNGTSVVFPAFRLSILLSAMISSNLSKYNSIMLPKN